MEFVIFLLIVAAVYLYRENRQQAAKLIDSALLIKDAATSIALLEAEIEKQDGLLEDYERRIALLKTQVAQQDQMIDELERWKKGAITLMKTLRTEKTQNEIQGNNPSASSNQNTENKG